MHFYALAHFISLTWLIGWAKGFLFGYTLKKAWAAIKVASNLIYQIVTLPVQIAALLGEQMEMLFRIIIAGLLFAAAIGTLFCVYKRGARIPLPTAC
ncbi:MAG: hypothetical protein ABR881_24840 [Candidatus Sulfotelmatobacter sp.]|jgi:hypothetical protein